jgi:signal transduction histidine kinase
MIEPTQFTSPAAKRVGSRQKEILQIWLSRARARVDTASSLSEPLLVNTMPALIINVAEALDAEHPRRLATESTSVAQEHGGERARLTRYGPNQVLQEYRILHEVIEDELRAAALLDEEPRAVLQKSFDKAIEEAVMAYHLVHSGLRNQFVAALSHDLRNPLAAARASAEFLLTLDTPDPAALEKFLRRIVNNVKRADRMIQTLLDSNSLQAGEPLRLTLEPCELRSLGEAIAADLPERERSLLVLNVEDARITCDIELVRRALENLVANAFKYGEETSPVQMEFRVILGRAVFNVRNDGEPIPVEEQGLLFDVLYRSAAARSSGKRGWGLGLAFVRAVCEAHQGSIGVSSAVDSGTTFTIDFPAEPQS